MFVATLFVKLRIGHIFTHGKTMFTSHVSPLRYLCTSSYLQNYDIPDSKRFLNGLPKSQRSIFNTYKCFDKHRTLISVDFLIALTVSFIQFKHFLNFLLIIFTRNATVFAFKMKLLCHHDLQTSKRMSN
jgi:hypothetical protein